MPSTPGPTPATPEPASLGFLHVLQRGSVVTYAIDRFTGQLRPSATQDVGDAHTLTGEPQGRYVFAAFGPSGGPPYWGPSIVAYAPDPVNGSLTALSEVSSHPMGSGGWYWLSASATRVYGMWGTMTYHDWYPAYVTHAVADDGQLGPAYLRELGEWDYGRVTVDVESNVLYKQGDTRLTAHFVEPDGSLTQMGASNLCVAMEVDYAKPVVAARGIVFALASPVGYSRSTTCSWEGARLAPRANLGLYAQYAAAVALRDGAPAFRLSSRAAALVAMRTFYSVKHGNHYQTKYEVRLFAISDDGDLELLDTVEPGFEWEGLFHPSGRFLYVSRVAYEDAGPRKLVAYSIDPQGRLEAVQTLENGGGVLAVTTPPQVRASAGLATD